MTHIHNNFTCVYDLYSEASAWSEKIVNGYRWDSWRVTLRRNHRQRGAISAAGTGSDVTEAPAYWKEDLDIFGTVSCSPRWRWIR
jgi:hypothetical protein